MQSNNKENSNPQSVILFADDDALCLDVGAVNGLLELSHFRSSDLSHIPFYSEADSLPPL